MSKFTRYLLNKVLWFLIAFAVALIFNFLLIRLIPGNPVDSLIAQMSLFGMSKGLLAQTWLFLVPCRFHTQLSPSLIWRSIGLYGEPILMITFHKCMDALAT